MRRWILSISICLLLGAGTTVAVAWGCVWLLDTSPDARERLSLERETEIYINCTPLDSKPVQEGIGWASRGLVARYEIAGTLPWHGFGRSPFEDHFIRITIVEAGWPIAALRGERATWDLSFPTSRWEEAFLSTGQELKGERMRGVVFQWRSLHFSHWWIFFPAHPVVMGFAANTLFYGIVYLTFMMASGHLLRVRRRRRGRCVRCGYDLRGDLDRGCSECGWNREP